MIAVDAATGEQVREVELPGVLGRVLWSAGGERAYGFDSSARRMTIVDLEAMAIERTVELPDGAFPTLFPFGTDISPDGRWLYLSAVDEMAECTELLNGPCIVNRPLGLQVIDLNTMAIVHEEPDINWLFVSPDGRWVIGFGFMLDYRGLSPGFTKYQTEVVPLGVKVIEVGSWEVAHLAPEMAFSSPVLSPDGRYVYLTSNGPGKQVRRGSFWPPCTEECSVITVIDLETLEVIATRVLDPGEGSLVGVPAAE